MRFARALLLALCAVRPIYVLVLGDNKKPDQIIQQKEPEEKSFTDRLTSSPATLRTNSTERKAVQEQSRDLSRSLRVQCTSTLRRGGRRTSTVGGQLQPRWSGEGIERDSTMSRNLTEALAGSGVGEGTAIRGSRVAGERRQIVGCDDNRRADKRKGYEEIEEERGCVERLTVLDQAEIKDEVERIDEATAEEANQRVRGTAANATKEEVDKEERKRKKEGGERNEVSRRLSEGRHRTSDEDDDDAQSVLRSQTRSASTERGAGKDEDGPRVRSPAQDCEEAKGGEMNEEEAEDSAATPAGKRAVRRAIRQFLRTGTAKFRKKVIKDETAAVALFGRARIEEEETKMQRTSKDARRMYLTGRIKEEEGQDETNKIVTLMTETKVKKAFKNITCCTYNTCSMVRHGRWHKLTTEFNKSKIDVGALQGTRASDKSIRKEWSCNGYWIISWPTDKNDAMGAVAIIISQKKFFKEDIVE